MSIFKAQRFTIPNKELSFKKAILNVYGSVRQNQDKARI